MNFLKPGTKYEGRFHVSYQLSQKRQFEDFLWYCYRRYCHYKATEWLCSRFAPSEVISRYKEKATKVGVNQSIARRATRFISIWNWRGNWNAYWPDKWPVFDIKMSVSCLFLPRLVLFFNPEGVDLYGTWAPWITVHVNRHGLFRLYSPHPFQVVSAKRIC